MALFNCTDEATAQRTDIAVYMDVTGEKGVDEGSEVYTNCGTGWTTFTESPSAQTKQRKYINEKTERNNVTRYAPQWAFECLLMYNRPEIRKIYDIVKQRKTGKDTVVTLIVVDLFDGTEKVHSARKVNAAVQISSLDDDDDMIIKGTFYNQGDEILGTFDMEKGVFTASGETPTDDETPKENSLAEEKQAE